MLYKDLIHVNSINIQISQCCEPFVCWFQETEIIWTKPENHVEKKNLWLVSTCTCEMKASTGSLQNSLRQNLVFHHSRVAPNPELYSNWFSAPNNSEIHMYSSACTHTHTWFYFPLEDDSISAYCNCFTKHNETLIASSNGMAFLKCQVTKMFHFGSNRGKVLTERTAK